MVNVVGSLDSNIRPVSHLTGTTSMLAAAAVADLDEKAILHYGEALGSFLLGTMMSGTLIQDNALQLGRRYGVALLLESLMLCVATVLLNRSHSAGYCVAACACGLQNAMVSTFNGTVLCTTVTCAVAEAPLFDEERSPPE